MLGVLDDWGGGVVVPLAVGLLGVALARLPRWARGHEVAVAAAGAASTFLAWEQDHLPIVTDALGEGPAWFVGAAILAGLATAAAVTVLLGQGRGPEGLAVLGVGLGAAVTALPDVEVLLGATVLWVPWFLLTVPRRTPVGHRRGSRQVARLVAVLAAVAVAAVAVTALVDGARGRPGSLLIAPIVVGPVVLVALLPPPRSWPSSLARLAVTGGIGLLVARLTALGDGSVRPLVGSVLGLLALVVLQRAATAAATLRPSRGR